MTTPPQGPEQQPGQQFPSPDQTWSARPPQGVPPQQPAPGPQGWDQHPQQFQGGPLGPGQPGSGRGPNPPKRWVWLLGGLVGLLVVAVVVVFAIDLTRPPTQPPTDGTSTDAPPTDDPTDDPTDAATGEVIPLGTDATLDPAMIDMTLETPSGFVLADDDPDYPRWDSGPYCYIGLSQYPLDDDGSSDAESTATGQTAVIDFYQDERLDVAVLVDDGRANLPLDDGRVLEAQVVELEFRRSADDPLLWSGFVTRNMPSSGIGVSVNYSCEADANRPSLDEVLAAVTILTTGESGDDGATTGTGTLTDPTWPTDRPILLVDQAPFLASTVGFEVTPPEGFEPAGELRWESSPACYIQVEVTDIEVVEDAAIPDSFVTNRYVEDVLALYEEQLADLEVMRNGERLELPVTTGHQVELAVLEVTYSTDAGRFWESMLVRSMPQIGRQITLIHGCATDEVAHTLAEIWAGAEVTP